MKIFKIAAWREASEICISIFRALKKLVLFAIHVRLFVLIVCGLCAQLYIRFTPLHIRPCTRVVAKLVHPIVFYTRAPTLCTSAYEHVPGMLRTLAWILKTPAFRNMHDLVTIFL